MANKKKNGKDTEIGAFAAFDGRNNLLFATVKPTKAEAEEALVRFNSPVEGFPYPYKVLPIFVGVDLYRQLSFDD